MGLEYEWKFAAAPAQLDAIAAAYPGQWKQLRMETVYYDTPTGALSARRITLRRRMENGAAICTVKTDLGNGARGEWECPCGSIADAVPILCKLGAPAELESLAADGLVAVCGAQFTRRAKLLPVPGGTAELALDCGVLRGGTREAPLCEMELERKSGDFSATAALAQQLANRFSLAVLPESKFRRAFALAKGE